MSTVGPLVTYGDVIAETIAILRAQLEARTEPYTRGVTYALDRPGTAAELPVLQVASDLDMVTYPIVSRSTIRISCWHYREDYANDLAQLAQAFLLAHTGDPLVGYTPLTGPLRGADQETGGRFASFTVRANRRSTPL